MVEPVAVNVVVDSGLSTAVSTPLIAKQVFSSGIAISVEPSPMTWNTICLEVVTA